MVASRYVRRYDLTFVLPSITVGMLGDGFDVTYRLAHAIRQRGLSVAIIFLADVRDWVPGYFWGDSSWNREKS
ncbi:MAG: hypothetical protein ACP5IE_05905 [Infirmifilum sp.]